MKEYTLTTCETIYNDLTFKLPDNFNLEKFMEGHTIRDIHKIEGYEEVNFASNVESYPDEWYSITDECGEVIAEY